MKKQMLHFLLLPTMVGTLAVTGCVHSHRTVVVREPAPRLYPTSQEVIITEAPPPPRREHAGRAPDTDHTWVDGYWLRTDGRWAWVPGHWGERPHQYVKWVPGHWDKYSGGRGWIWTEGHWE